MVKHSIDWYKIDNSQIKLELLGLKHQYKSICQDITLEQSESNYFKKFEIKQQIDKLLIKYNSNLKYICYDPKLLTFDNIFTYNPSFFIF